jgi:hypothetical protein
MSVSVGIFLGHVTFEPKFRFCVFSSLKREKDKEKKEKLVMTHNQASPYDRAGLISKLTFYWLWPLLGLAQKGGLEGKDIPGVPEDLISSSLSERLEQEWERSKTKGSSPYYLALAIFHTLKWDFFVTFWPLLFADISIIAAPLLVEKLIVFIDCSTFR